MYGKFISSKYNKIVTYLFLIKNFVRKTFIWEKIYSQTFSFSPKSFSQIFLREKFTNYFFWIFFLKTFSPENSFFEKKFFGKTFSNNFLFLRKILSRNFFGKKFSRFFFSKIFFGKFFPRKLCWVFSEKTFFKIVLRETFSSNISKNFFSWLFSWDFLWEPKTSQDLLLFFHFIPSNKYDKWTQKWNNHYVPLSFHSLLILM